ncbi:MAG: restriction endonuclease subunit S [Candidatus Methanoperedens sp.]|nr:restriction endonuclease subunit S [Candidatus Methanoperedens sp.]MCZ7369317.1 restriction endonuclease subunit S [Candidatus Methanoperedens sp.]
MMANNVINGETTKKESEGTTAGCTLNASVKTSWRLVKLGEHIDLLTGFPFKSAQYTNDSESIKLLRGDNVAQGCLRWEGVKLWPLSKSGDFTRYLLKRGDVILAMDRPWIEAGLKYAWVKKHDPPCLLVQRVARLRGINGLLTEYLRYVIADQSFTDYIKPIVTGVSVPHISPSQINAYMFWLPSVELQSKIAAILSAYDDLIENNTRRIKILEEMAQALYREWFVNLRFPGHEKVRMVESELGMIPQGWEVVTIRDVSDYINRGVSPKYDDQSSQIVINQKCIREGKFNQDLVRRHASKIPVEKSIKFGDVLINSTGIGTLGRIAQIYKEIPDCTVDSHVTIVRPNDKVSIDYFGSYMSTLEPHFDSQGIGSTGQTELGRETIAKTSFLLPPRSIQDRFTEISSPMHKSIIEMFAKNANFRRTRDLLLPKLISGEVDAENIDISVQ